MPRTLGQRLRRFRRKKGLSQRALGALLGLKHPQQGIWDWESNRSRIPIAMVPLLVETLGLASTDEFLGYKAPPPAASPMPIQTSQ